MQRHVSTVVSHAFAKFGYGVRVLGVSELRAQQHKL